MMTPFPEEWQLISLFETEPSVLDAGIPWAYNSLTFDTTRGNDRILCVIEPSVESMNFTWWHNRIRRLALDLHWVSGITVAAGSGGDYMVATFRDRHLLPLRLQFRPTIECAWATSMEPLS